jgi:Big-like domain-containing protein
MRRLSLTILVLVAALSGCSKHASDTTAPPPAPPVPELVAMNPPARTPSALYDSDIWAQFDRPLDARTITTLNVYLKLDAQRIPITVSYDAAAQRVTLTPTVVLELQRTYTVEFSTAVKGSDGTPLAPGVFFQFTTNSLRRPTYDFPIPTSLEGPVATLCWGGAQGPTNNIFYELYASTDSAAVEARTAPMLLRSVFTRFVPATGWPLGSTIYWAVTSENLTTHERLAGSVRSFQTLDPGTPIDSVVIRARDHGSKSATSTQQFCSQKTFSTGGGFNGALHWDLSPIPTGVRLQGATVTLSTTSGSAGTIATSNPTLWITQNDWSPCSIVSPGPPWNELTGYLASAVAESPSTAVFTSDRLAGLLEAQYLNRGLLFGTLVKADQVISFQSTLADDVPMRPTGVIRFYRLPAVPRP